MTGQAEGDKEAEETPEPKSASQPEQKEETEPAQGSTDVSKYNPLFPPHCQVSCRTWWTIYSSLSPQKRCNIPIHHTDELKAGYNHGKVLYAILDGNAAYCMNFGLSADGGQQETCGLSRCSSNAPASRAFSSLSAQKNDKS